MEIAAIVLAAILGYVARRIRYSAVLFTIWVFVLVALVGASLRWSGGKVSPFEVVMGLAFAGMGIFEYARVRIRREAA